MEASSLSSSWRRHPHCNGVVIVDVQVSLQSRHLCHHCNNIVALVAMSLLPLSSWCCCPCHDGIITIVIVQASLPYSQWRHCPCCTGDIANIAWALSPCCNGIIVIIPLTSLPSLYKGIVTIVAPMLLPPPSWHVFAVECGYN